MSRLDLAPNELGDAHLSLRHWREQDARGLVTELQDPEVSRWTAGIPSPYTDEDAAAFLRLAERKRKSETGCHLGVFTRAGDVLAGGVALAPVDWSNRAARLGYWTAAARRNRGIARTASRLVIAWAFGPLELERIELHCAPENVPSQRVAEALGFRREGLLRGHLRTAGGRRDSLVYGLLSSDLG